MPGLWSTSSRNRGEHIWTAAVAQPDLFQESLQVEASSVAEKLEVAGARLRRAEAFALPELDALRLEVSSLERRAGELAAELARLAPSPLAVPAPAAALADAFTVPPPATASLRERLNWDRLKAMSNEERFELAKDMGPAFGVSVAIVAFCYWSISLPLLFYAYHEATGAWPSFEELGSLDSGRAAGAVAGILSLAALMKPVRIMVALTITPWVADNVLPSLPWLGGQRSDEAGGKGGRA